MRCKMRDGNEQMGWSKKIRMKSWGTDEDPKMEGSCQLSRSPQAEIIPCGSGMPVQAVTGVA